MLYMLQIEGVAMYGEWRLVNMCSFDLTLSNRKLPYKFLSCPMITILSLLSNSSRTINYFIMIDCRQTLSIVVQCADGAVSVKLYTPISV